MWSRAQRYRFWIAEYLGFLWELCSPSGSLAGDDVVGTASSEVRDCGGLGMPPGVQKRQSCAGRGGGYTVKGSCRTTCVYATCSDTGLRVETS